MVYLPPHLLSKFYKVSVLVGLAIVGRGLDTRVGGVVPVLSIAPPATSLAEYSILLSAIFQR